MLIEEELTRIQRSLHYLKEWSTILKDRENEEYKVFIDLC
jgi:hypothetical protein